MTPYPKCLPVNVDLVPNCTIIFYDPTLKKIVPPKNSLGYKIFTCPKNGVVKLFERYLILDGKLKKAMV